MFFLLEDNLERNLNEEHGVCNAVCIFSPRLYLYYTPKQPFRDYFLTNFSHFQNRLTAGIPAPIPIKLVDLTRTAQSGALSHSNFTETCNAATLEANGQRNILGMV
jgi:hypothetical protein